MPQWAASLQRWQWAQIAGTALSSVEPAVRPLGNSGPRSKIEAWNGATLRRRGSVYMLGAAGGHGDYAGNEVNALALYSETPKWVELRAPSANSTVLNETQFYLDNRPAATHTYSATQFVGRLDRMVVIASPGLLGQFPAAPSGYPYTGDKRSYSFDYAKSDWDAPDHIAAFPGNGDYIACLCVRHPLTDDIYYSRSYSDGWYRWTSAANRWDKLSNVSRNPWYAGSAIDTRRDRILIVGGWDPMAPELRTLAGTRISATFGGLGASALTMGSGAGVIYDEVNDIFIVAFNSDGIIKLLTVTAGDLTVASPSLSGETPAARPNGVRNSLQYVPELGGMVVANSYTGNVYFMRTS